MCPEPAPPDMSGMPGMPEAPRAADPAAPLEPLPAPAPPEPLAAPASPEPQPRNPLHGLTLQSILERLVQAYGWPGLAERIALRCFSQQPSVASSLKVLRKTPWAREKVESLYLYLLRDERRRQREGRSPGADAL